MVWLCALWPVLAYAAPSSLSVKAVKVESDGVFKGAPIEDPALIQSCVAKTLSDVAAMYWFKHATQVPNETFQERATITGCTFSGHLQTADGQIHLWHLDLGGAGVVYVTASNAVSLVGPEPATSPR